MNAFLCVYTNFNQIYDFFYLMTCSIYFPSCWFLIVVLFCSLFHFPRYNEVANNVQTQETILNIQFVLLDCSPLKYAILSHCQEWQNKFTTLLSEIAIASLQELTAYLKQNGHKWVLSKAKCLLTIDFYKFLINRISLVIW